MRPVQVEIKLLVSGRQTNQFPVSASRGVRDISPEVLGSCRRSDRRQRRRNSKTHSRDLVSTCPDSTNTVRLCRPLRFVSGGGFGGGGRGGSFQDRTGGLQTKCQAMDSRVASGICCVLRQSSTRRKGERASPARYSFFFFFFKVEQV